LLIESRLGIRGRDVRLVAALLAAEVDAGVRGAGRPLAAALSALRPPLVAFLPTLLGVRFRLEAFQGRPGFDQRAVYREVLAAHQARGPRLLDHPTEELPRNIMLHEALPVLREGAVVERSGRHVDIQKPPKQQVVRELLAQEALASHRK